MVCGLVYNYAFILFQPYFQKTKTPQSLLIRLRMPYPFPSLQSQQQCKNLWWAAKREKQGKPRSHTLSGLQMAEYHQQEVPWVRIKIFRSRFWEPAGVHDGYIGQQVIIKQPIVISQWKPCLFCIFLLASTHALFHALKKHSCFSKCVSHSLERKGNLLEY